MKQLIENAEFNQRLKGANDFNASMKKPKPGAVMKVDQKKFEKSYNIQSQAAIDKLLSTSFHPWVEYPVFDYSPTLQKNYEIFCGGWLHFWDLNVSTEAQERQLYFKWTKQSVVIYISNPTPTTKTRITVIIESPGDPPKAPPPPPPGDA